MGDSTGLVENNLCHFCGSFEGSSTLDQNTIFGTDASANHNGSEKRREPEDKNHGDEIASKGVGESLNRCTRSLRILHKLDDLTELSITTSPSDSEVYSTIAIDCATDDVVAYSFLNGHRLTSNHTLIDKGLASNQNTIGGELITGSKDYNIA
ncbi:hypothetical protein HG531_012714 [Fusarium graminearum]|nr:hypothetical protein HG531_012714 [Fusarium graminearum]